MRDKTGRVSVLIFYSRYLSLTGTAPVELYLYELARRWVSEGNQVTIFCSNSKNGPSFSEVKGVQILRRGNSLTVYIWAALHYLTQFKGKYDVIIDCEHRFPFFTPLYADLPVIYFAHPLAHEFGKLNRLFKFIETTLIPRVYRHAGVVTISTAHKQLLTQKLRLWRTIKTIFPGITRNKHLTKKSKHPLIVYNGNLVHEQAFTCLVKTFRKVLAVRPRATLAILDPSKKLAQELKKELPVKSVTIASQLTEEQKIRLLGRAWVAVDTSPQAESGSSVLEANSCGTPVVCTDTPGVSELVRQGLSGFVVPVGDDYAFARAINRIVSHTYIRERMENLAIAWAEKFSWERTAQQFLEFIKSFARPRPRPRRTTTSLAR